MNRRQFLLASAGLAGLALLRPAFAQEQPERMLVLVHLFGGNDALNTVVPVGDSRYRRARPTLALGSDQLVGKRQGLALHGALAPLLPLWESGKMAIVNGVGYPNSNQSHFISSDVWHTGRSSATMGDGWLGRYLDLAGASAVNVDETLTRALWSSRTQPLCVRSPGSFQLVERDREMVELIGSMYADGPDPHLGATYREMSRAFKRLARCPGEERRSNDFRQSLAAVLALMPEANIYHTTLSGFDTHSNQSGKHHEVLSTLATGLAEFWKELERRGWADRTTVVAYSEFGRRVQENGSGGTDHGAAGVSLVLGPSVRGGFQGDYPDLGDLDKGNLRHTVDFRRLYAGLLEGWLEVDSARVLGGRFEALPLFA